MQGVRERRSMLVTSQRRAVVLSSCAGPPGAWLQECVQALRARFDEVLVAIDDASGEPELAPLPLRWAAVRSLLAESHGVWTTPLVPAVGLASVADQSAALPARLGQFAALYTDSPRWLPCSRALGIPVELLAHVAAKPMAPFVEPKRSYALVVARAQPFHRGHLALVERALELADEVLLVVAAAELAFSARDPFTAGERMALVRAGLGRLCERIWLLALPAPSWPAMALQQLAFVTPRYEIVVAHNPVLRVLAAQQGKAVTGLAQLLVHAGQTISASLIRQRLCNEGPGRWLSDLVPDGTAELLQSDASLAERCAVIAAAGG